VNLTRTGSGDKAALEAMSCARPSLLANEGFRDLLGPHASRLLFPRGDAGALAERLQDVLRLGPDERARIGGDLRGRVAHGHGLDRLAERLVGLLAEEAARKARRRTA
jgi:glycosyltransferase involved in cell wall biosynthesis